MATRGGALVALGVSLALAGLAHADPTNQLFQPFCSQGFDASLGLMRWSNPVTWTTIGFTPPPASTSTGAISSTSNPIGNIVQSVADGIPGVGSLAGANVTIPCSVGILLDVPGVSLLMLEIRGLLMVEDPTDRVVNYQVNASFVLVRGSLVVGTAARHFNSFITFTLMPNPNGRAALSVTGPVLPNRTSTTIESGTAGVGHKTFVVAGGQVSLRGMPGGGSSPSWVKLVANVDVGDQSLQVDQDVSALWPLNSTIVVASTDFDPQQAEVFRIIGYLSLPTGGTVILVDRPFTFKHWGDPYGLPDGFGGFIDERAEVALLSRNIVIQGLDEPDPFRFEGGHFVVQQTNSAQVLDGVNFNLLGQQGTLGRYPVHFHICSDTGGRSIVRKNSVTNSKQRCYVNHASHNLTFDSNVAYNTSGHCFLLEEGGEQDNTWVNNLGILTTGPRFVIMKGATTDETDGEPATFWVTNLNNNIINNVGAGSTGSGMWIELKGNVRGASLNIPEIASVRPLMMGGGVMSGNTVHSNTIAGVRAYPHGIRPPADLIDDPDDDNQTALNLAWDGVKNSTTFSGFTVYKHKNLGMFYQATGGVILTNCTFADNLWGLYIQSNTRGAVRNSRFVGETPNVGTAPTLAQCSGYRGWRMCAPITGCQFPITQRSNVRYLGNPNAGLSFHWQTPMVGIVMVAPGFWAVNSPNARLVGNQFSGFDSTCSPSAAVSTGYPMAGDWWDAAVGSQGMQLAPGTMPVWFPTPTVSFTNETVVWRAAAVSQTDSVWQDKDGSTMGGTPGYLIANHPFLLPPPSKPQCTPLPAANALSCPGLCYRSVFVDYFENASFVPKPSTHDIPLSIYQPGDLSRIVLVREEDGATRIHHGMMLFDARLKGTNLKRSYWFNLLANQTYTLYVYPPAGNPNFWPSTLRIFYVDGWDGQKPCRGAVTVRLMPKQDWSSQWALVPSDLIFWKPCPGAGNLGSWPVSYEASCAGGYITMLITLGATLASRVAVNFVSSNTSALLCSSVAALPCGIVHSGDVYTYNTSGVEQRNLGASRVGYHNVAFNDSTWASGPAIIGFVQYVGPGQKTRTVPPGKGRLTFYYRNVFTLSSTACFTGLVVDFYPSAGLLVYLNGVEILRYNMPGGTITASSFSLSPGIWTKTPTFLSTATIPLATQNSTPGSSLPALRVGANVLAYETHTNRNDAYTVFFDSRAYLLSTC